MEEECVARAALVKGSGEMQGVEQRGGTVGLHVRCSECLVTRWVIWRRIVTEKPRNVKIVGNWGILQGNVRGKQRGEEFWGVVHFVEGGTHIG